MHSNAIDVTGFPKFAVEFRPAIGLKFVNLAAKSSGMFADVLLQGKVCIRLASNEVDGGIAGVAVNEPDDVVVALETSV